MQTFTKPINLNGAELRQELNAAGIVITNERGAVVLDGETLFLDIAEGDAEAAQAIVAAHNGTI